MENAISIIALTFLACGSVVTSVGLFEFCTDKKLHSITNKIDQKLPDFIEHEIDFLDRRTAIQKLSGGSACINTGALLLVGAFWKKHGRLGI